MGKKLSTLILMMSGLLVSTSAVANTLPVAAFNTTLNTGLGVMNVQFDGSISTDSDGTIVSYSWNFGDGTTGSSALVSKTYSSPGTYNVSLTVTDNLSGSKTLTKSIEVRDFQPPIVSFTNTYNSSNIFVQSLPVTVDFLLDVNEPLELMYIGVEWYWLSYPYSISRTYTTEGMQTFSFKARDLGENETTLNYPFWIILDNDIPTIEVLPHPSLTKNSSIPLSVVVSDAAPVSTVVKVNGATVATLTSKTFTYSFSLPTIGNNLFEIVSTDAAGNISATKSFTIVRDNVLPVLSALVPANSASIDRVAFEASGVSSKPLSEVYLNDTRLVLSADKLSFSGPFTTQTMGTHNLVWRGIDLAGNETTVNSTITVAPRLLISELISIVPDAASNHLVIVGAIGATRPGVEISAKEGLFSWNRASTVADSYGAFKLKLDPFSSISITADDSSTSETETITKSYLRSTTLSGVVKDDDNNPIPGVTVFVGGVSAGSTDGSGVFLVNTPKTGEQAIVFDGSTVSTSFTGPNKKFFKTSVVFNIGLSQENVLSRPIYLVPHLTDGTETTISSGSGATVTSVHAPGVSISIPSGVTTFPGGATSGSISLKEVLADRSTIPVPRAAVPTKVLAMEPSGLKFSERVEITLPNVNELPPGVEMMLLSMNSTTGMWELDGMAKVTSDGQSVRTKPGQGISHFSSVYAVPVAPRIFNVGSRGTTGIDVSTGSFSTAISLPTFKSGTKDVGVSLRYKSAWANPTAVVSNMINIPESRTVVKETSTNVYDKRLQHSLETCSIFGCSTKHEVVMGQLEVTDHVQLQSWYQPESIRSQFFVGGIATDKIDFNNIQDAFEPASGSQLPGSIPLNSSSTNILEFEGIPNQSMITYAVPLVKENGDFLETGVYPALARYEIKLKHLTILTGYRSSTLRADGFGVISQQTGDPQDYEKTTIVNQTFPEDVRTNILLQNKVKSPYGRGWHLNSHQRILNPKSSSIVIEEADGRLSTYVQTNSVSTLFNGVERDTSVEYGTVGLKQWPWAYVTTFGRIFHDTSIGRIDLTAEEPMFSPKTIHPVGDIVTGSGEVGNLGWNSCPAFTNAHIFTTTKTPYKMRGLFPVLMQKPGGGYLGINHLESSLFEYSGSAVTKLAGSNFDPFSPNTNSAPGVLSSLIEFVTGWDAWLSTTVTTYSCFNARPANPARYSLIYSTGTAGSASDYFLEGTGDIGVNPNYLGLSAPKDMIIDSNGVILVSDYGNNRIKSFNTSTGEAKVIFGNGQTWEDDLDGTWDIALKNPKGMVMDSNGNLYVSNKTGYIRVLRPNGTSSVVAGKPLTEGGINSSDAPAKQMAFDDPYGLAFDEVRNFLYVADTGNHRVVRIDFNTGLASTVAGSGVCEPYTPPVTKSALLDSLCGPTMISLDPDQNLIIVDAGHNKIKRVSFNFGQASTLAFDSTNDDGSKLFRSAAGAWTREYRNGVKDVFDVDGNQTKSIDRGLREINYVYDSNGRVLSVTNSFGQVTQYNYSGNKISSIVDPALRTTTFSYNNDFLSQVVYPDGTSTSYEYDSNGLLTKEYNKRNVPTTYAYNLYNRIEKVTAFDGRQVEINDMESGSMANSFSGGNVGQLKPSGFETGKFKDSTVDAKGNQSSVVRSFNGYIVRMMDAKGRITNIERDLSGRPLKVTNPDGGILEYTYDPVTFDLLSVNEPVSGANVSMTYDSHGNVISETNALGKTTIRTYDLVGRLISIVSEGGSKSVYTYNSAGLMETISQGSGTSLLTWTFEYDLRGNLIKFTGPDGKYTEYELDLAGNILKAENYTTTGVLAITQNEWSSVNNLTKVITPKNEVTNYHYLETGELSKITNAVGKEINFSYDLAGRLLQRTDETGAQVKLSYDENGNVASEIDPNGKSKIYVYDEMNYLASEIRSDERIDFQRNFRGDVTQIKNGTTQIDYVYDTQSNVVSHQTTGLGILSTYPVVELENTYDIGRNKKSLTTVHGSISYSHNDDNRITQIQNSWGDTFSYSFDAYNRLSSISRPGSQTNRVYSSLGELEAINHVAGGVLKTYVEYEYDLRNWPVLKRSPAGTTSYNYDKNGQLLNVAGPGSASESFTYDSVGNRLTDSGGTSVFDYNSKRLSSDVNYNYYYDNNGNLTNKIAKDIMKNSFNYTYSTRNQMIRMEEFGPPYGEVLRQVDYQYDVLGRRIQKVAWDKNALLDPKKTYTRKYVYDGSNILFEFNGTNVLLAKYTHGFTSNDDVLGISVTSDGVTAGVATSAGNAYYLKDNVGTVTDIINSSGTIVQTHHYSGFGKIEKITNGSGVDITSNPTIKPFFMFTGREWDSEAGLYYYRARAYDPSLGRFLQKDADPGRLQDPLTVTNSYIYARNAPTMFTDSSGNTVLEDIVGYLFTVTHGIYNMLMGVVTLDIARFAGGVVLWMEFVLAPVTLIATSRLPKYEEWDGMGVVKNSLIAEIAYQLSGKSNPAFSLGAVSFVKRNDNEAELRDTIMHEYGHYLQYLKMGGLEFLIVGNEEKGKHGKFEDEADTLACDYWRKRGFEYRPSYGRVKCGATNEANGM